MGFHALARLEFSLDAEGASHGLFDLLYLSYESLHSAFQGFSWLKYDNGSEKDDSVVVEERGKTVYGALWPALPQRYGAG